MEQVTWKPLKPHAQSLLHSVAFPLLCFGEQDAALWEEARHSLRSLVAVLPVWGPLRSSRASTRFPRKRTTRSAQPTAR